MYSAKAAIASTALSLWAFSAGAVTVTPTDAMVQVGHTAKVCGLVASAVYEANSRAHPTFLTLLNVFSPTARKSPSCPDAARTTSMSAA